MPTPVLSEVLVHADDAAPSYLAILGNTSRFRIVPFEERAAIELAEMTRRAHEAGDLRAGTDATRAQLKFDRQILAVARVEGENHVYTDDHNMRTFAEAEDEASRLAATIEFAEFEDSRLHQLAVVKAVETIGEAASQ